MLTEEQRIKNIQEAIRSEGQRLREKLPWLKHQDRIGFLIFSFAVTGVLLCGWAYVSGYLPAWLCIPFVAILTSLLHELEHDLIHWQYFRRQKFVHHFMLLGGWILRQGTINPWIRRHLHFLHHKTSGTIRDKEERGIGNGRPYGFLRWWIMMDTFTGNLVNALINSPKGKRRIHLFRLIAANFPFAVLCAGIWYLFVLFHLIEGIALIAGLSVQWSVSTLQAMAWINTLVVVLIAPFYLRSFCLNFISSNMHYYGDVRSLLEQTQVLNAWYLFPFQLFCFNFGSTHGIHHFVVGEPFYIRQMTAKKAHLAMRENGVRFNDMGTFERANRFQISSDSELKPV